MSAGPFGTYRSQRSESAGKRSVLWLGSSSSYILLSFVIYEMEL
jgi:hypothetical protein